MAKALKLDPRFLSDALLYSTVRIEAEVGESEMSEGTGFFVSFLYQGKFPLITLFTNKHVVRGARRGFIRCHTGKEPSGDFIDLTIENFEARCVPHPDPDVDLCGFVLVALDPEIKKTGKTVFCVPFKEESLWDDEALGNLRALEDVVMIGYPNGIWDTENNLPIIRRGSTATPPSLDFCGRAEGLVDIAAIPGSSGSPVMVLNEGRWESKQGGLMMGNRLVLLGVLFAGPVHDAEGRLEFREIPTSTQAVTLTPLTIHLGKIIKAKELLRVRDLIFAALDQARPAEPTPSGVEPQEK